ncbi:MAG TPA: esterase family protein [Candidatus Faecousia intestinigallinarum]|nr:esterase family protein [Candidatus Faecousia intestinigallinarum]
MAFLRMEFSSRALEMCTSLQVVLPDEGDMAQAKVVYLFHGLSDNCTGWTRFSACERYARERGIALVIPEVQRSFYADCAYGLNYFTYVSQELPQAMHRFFGLSLEREKNYVMGLSMGGYGALKCALNYPERFAGVGSFSGVTDAEIFKTGGSLRDREVVGLFGGAQEVAPENDLASLLARAENLPPIYLSCGEQDRLYPMNCAFAEKLAAKGAVYRFDHRPGGHSWDFWDRSLEDCFAYHFGEKVPAAVSPRG